MQPESCPRCKFRIVTRSRACSTCGFIIPPPESMKAGDANSKNANKVSLWGKFLGIASSSSADTEPVQAQEKPALG